jgi:hypothetical protein
MDRVNLFLFSGILGPFSVEDNEVRRIIFSQKQTFVSAYISVEEFESDHGIH